MKSIAQALRAIKGYGWMKAPVKEIEDYIETGDAATLKKINCTKGSGGYWGGTLAESLRPIEAWQEDDRRAVHALAKSGCDDDVWQLLDSQIRQEKEGQDLHRIVAKELEAGGGGETPVARDTMKWVHHLVGRDNPNSAGRYLLALTDAVLAFNGKAINKERHYASDLGAFTGLMISFAPERLPKLVNDLLVHETGKGNSRIDHGVHQLNLQVVAALLKGDKDKYGPVVAAAIPKVRDSWNTFQVAQLLYEASPDTYAVLALTAARESLMGHPSENNHGPVADFMIKHFGREVLPDILTYFESKKDHALHWQHEILKSAAAAFGMEALPAVDCMLHYCDNLAEKLANAKPGNYEARSKIERINANRLSALEQLIAMNDGSQDPRIQAELEKGLGSESSGTVLPFLALAGKWNIQKLMDKIWALLEHKSKPVRETAARLLARGGEDTIDKAQSLLTHKKGDVRSAAAFLLASINTPKALEILESRLDKEENDDVRDQMLLGLEAAWAKQGRKVTKKDVEKRIKRAADKLDEPVLKWLKPETLPPVKWSDGGKVNAQAVAYLLYRQSRAKEMRADVEAKAMFDLLDRESSGDFARALLAGFVASKQEAGDRWVMTAACKLGDDSLVPVIAGQIRQWVDANRGKLAEYAVQALALLGTDAALLTVDSMAIRYRSKMKNVGKAAAEAFASAAEVLGISTEELGDRVVPWLGFEPGKPYIVESGSGQFEVSIGTDFKLAYKDLTKNKAVKSLPKSCPAEVLKSLKEASANLKEAVKSQLLRLENLLVRQRRWPVARWKQLYLGHPLMLPFAVRLVWGHFDDNGKRVGLFRALEDRTLTTVTDDPYELGDKGQIGLIHPLDLDDAILDAWRTHLADYEIDPPFPQLDRKVVRVDEKDANRKVYGDLHGNSLNAMTFKGRAERLGWTRGSVCDGGGITSYVKTFPAAGADIILAVDDFYIGIDMYSDMKLGDVMFVRNGSVTFGSYSYDEPRDEEDPRVLRFGEVPPIVFSEAMGDLQTIAGKKQEGTEE